MRLIHTPTFACGVRPPALRKTAAWRPPVDVLETESEYVLRLDAAGVAEASVSVKLEDGLLRIQGEREAQKSDGQRYRIRERRAGTFRRSFRLPEAIDADGIEAKYERGVLEIRIPKIDRSRKIPVQ